MNRSDNREFVISSEDLSQLPEYIRSYADNMTVYKNARTVYIRCMCKCEKFDVYKNALNKEERKLKKLYDEAVKEEIGSWNSVYPESDIKGVVHWYKKKFPFGRKEVYPPKEPDFLRLILYKAKCSECGKEILLFDSRFIGQNALEKGADLDLERYVPELQILTQNSRVSISYEIDEDDDPEDFSEITIAAIAEGKHIKLFEYEM